MYSQHWTQDATKTKIIRLKKKPPKKTHNNPPKKTNHNTYKTKKDDPIKNTTAEPRCS
jgi:hypothetical protein